jgi:hypothetical protein
MFAPRHQVCPKAFQVQFAERFFCAVQVVERPLEKGASARAIASGLVMKGHRELHQALEMTSQRRVARGLAPQVFEGFMGLEEAGAIEQSQAVSEVVSLHDFEGTRVADKASATISHIFS